MRHPAPRAGVVTRPMVTRPMAGRSVVGRTMVRRTVVRRGHSPSLVWPAQVERVGVVAGRPSGVVARLRVAGTVYDPSLAPSPQEVKAYGYLSATSLATSGETALVDQLKIQVAEPGRATPSRDRDAISAAAGDVGQWLQRERGLRISEIQVPEPYAHPHQG